eukprot:174498-Prorocentrum_minimum.AAC.1
MEELHQVGGRRAVGRKPEVLHGCERRRQHHPRRLQQRGGEAHAVVGVGPRLDKAELVEERGRGKQAVGH